ncbi:hypothetical protein [Novipirellula rosea]|uniref:hypothetical protein n=1 Tax=Novipirellula rosea TaxID=1031540 RepID=UPI0031ED0598
MYHSRSHTLRRVLTIGAARQQAGRFGILAVTFKVSLHFTYILLSFRIVYHGIHAPSD